MRNHRNCCPSLETAKSASFLLTPNLLKVSPTLDVTPGIRYRSPKVRRSSPEPPVPPLANLSVLRHSANLYSSFLVEAPKGRPRMMMESENGKVRDVTEKGWAELVLE